MGYNLPINEVFLGVITHFLTIYQLPGTSKYLSWNAPSEGAIQAGKDGVSDAADAEDATVAAVAGAGVDQASLVVVGGWWLVEGEKSL